MSRQSARSGLRPDRKNYRNFPRPWGIIVVVSGEVYLSLHGCCLFLTTTATSVHLYASHGLLTLAVSFTLRLWLNTWRF
jgi:hypothetical protein